MKPKRNQYGSDAESSDDEQIIELPENDFVVEDENDDDVMFENSQQDLTQPIPRKSDNNNGFQEDDVEMLSPKKKKKRKESSLSTESQYSQSYNRYCAREIDTSEIPDHIIANLKRVLPKQSDCLNEGLTTEAVQKASSSSKGGVWILKCPLDVNLSDLLPGKKLSLDGEQTIIDTEDDDDNAQLTQYVPTNSLGLNVKGRQFEATSIVNDDYKYGAALLLPDADKFKLVTTPIQGHIIIRESVKELDLPKIKTPKLRPRKLPAGIKERHPVYGADFTKIVNEMESAPKKKKKSSKPSNGFVFEHPTNLVVPKIEVESEDSTYSRKKKKKDKNCEIYDIANNGNCANEFENASVFDEDGSSRKKKSKKRKREELENSYDSNDLDKTVLIEFTEPETKKHKKSKHKTHN